MQMRFEGTHPNGLLIHREDHMHDCRGIEFGFLRVLEQIDIKICEANPTEPHAIEVTARSLLQNEKDALGQDYDQARNMFIL